MEEKVTRAGIAFLPLPKHTRITLAEALGSRSDAHMKDSIASSARPSWRRRRAKVSRRQQPRRASHAY